jgi:septin family protein
VAERGKKTKGARYSCDGKCLTIIAFVISILVVGAGGFLLGTVFARPIGAGGAERANAIVEEAKRRIAPPTLPAKPAGHTVTVNETKTIVIRAPNPAGIGLGVPEQVQITVPTTKLVGATPEETAKWQTETDNLQVEYEKKLAEEARKIANEMFVNDWRSAVVLFKKYSADVIVPFLAAIAGIVGAIVTLMKAFRTKTDAN